MDIELITNRTFGVEQEVFDEIRKFIKSNGDKRIVSHFQILSKLATDNDLENPYVEAPEVERYFVWLCKEDGELVGVGALSLREVEVTATSVVDGSFTIVHSKHRNNGVGKTLFREKLRMAKAEGVKLFTTWIGETNITSRRMVERSGLMLTGKQNTKNDRPIVEYELDLANWE